MGFVSNICERVIRDIDQFTIALTIYPTSGVILWYEVKWDEIYTRMPDLYRAGVISITT
jgi:hypothetical protein